MGELLIGTSGYDYPEWVKVFYPADLKREDYLSYYATKFSCLELNFSYYAIPTAEQLTSMIKRTAGHVRFSIKGNRQFTHEIKVSYWRDAVREFRNALTPFLNDGLLLSVLLQFPQSFRYNDDTRRYLADLIAEFGAEPLIVEFRHSEWFTPRVYEGLTARGVGLCLCDMPELSKLPTYFRLNRPPLVLGQTGYVRFHGRNTSQWYASENSRDRYDYQYHDDEIAAYSPLVKEMQGKAKIVQVYFNNHAKGAAAVNAQKAKILMGT